MNLTLLGQGYEPISDNSVGKALIKFFADKKFHSFTGISAFASQAGVNGLSKHITAAKKHLNIITIVTGIDQKGTSKEALEALLNLNVKTFIFYQPSTTIFHPKIYLFEGKEKSELIIGSSNLTSHGLFTNVEASILVSVDNNKEADRKIVEQLKDYFKGIFDFTDPNLQKLSKKIIAELVTAKVVPTEAERKAAQDELEKADRAETKKIISKIFPKRAIAKVPTEFRGSPKPKTPEENKPTKPIVIKSKRSKLLWTSGPLKERDLNIPKGSKTNPTGEMLFKKGKTKGVDQRHYFRDEVFKDLKWSIGPNENTSKPHLESANALFKIMVDGIDCGDFKLVIIHDPRKDTRTYEQKNSTTAVRWGAAKRFIAKENLIGKNASLYNNNKTGEFTLEII